MQPHAPPAADSAAVSELYQALRLLWHRMSQAWQSSSCYQISPACRPTHRLLQGVLHHRVPLQPRPSCIRPASCRCHRRGVRPWRCAWQRRVPAETLGCCLLLTEGCWPQAWHRHGGGPCSLHMAPPCRVQACRVLSTSAIRKGHGIRGVLHPPSPFTPLYPAGCLGVEATHITLVNIFVRLWHPL